MEIRKRILQYLEYKGISTYQFYKEIGVSNGFLDKEGAIGTDKCEKICYQYTDLDPLWLILERGNMILSENSYKVPENDIKILKSITRMRRMVCLKTDRI